MSVTLGQLLALTWARMGTNSRDPEYPRDVMVTYLNLALGELHSDCAKLAGGDVLLVTGRTITKTADRQFAFAEQDPAITSVLQVRRVRVSARDVAPLDPVPAESIEIMGDYALTGPDSAIILRTSTALNAQSTLVMDYTVGPSLLVEDADNMPAWLPDQYRDVPELMAAQAALPQGGESSLSRSQSDKLEDRRGQLWTHWSSRSPGPSARR